MASYADQATVAASDPFINRVQMAMLNHALYRVNAGNDAEGYVTLGKAIAKQPTQYAPQFAQSVATQPIVQNGIASSPVDGADVTDTQILGAVETIYPAFVR